MFSQLYLILHQYILHVISFPVQQVQARGPYPYWSWAEKTSCHSTEKHVILFIVVVALLSMKFHSLSLTDELISTNK